MRNRSKTRTLKVTKPLTQCTLEITLKAKRVLTEVSDTSIDSSQDQLLSTPATSPLKLTKSTIKPSPSPSSSITTASQRRKQSYLSFGLNERKKCQQCGMTYSKNLKSDVKFHQKYHDKASNGRDWTSNWGEKVQNFTQNEYIVKINPMKQAEANAAIEMLDIVNKELNAPDDNKFWLSGQDKGSVFVYVKNKVAIGVISVERKEVGLWFSVEDGKIISNTKIDIFAGINRVHVCQNSRRQGIAMRLLRCVQNHFIYGMVIPPRKLSWSQPSFSGGKLAMQFNGVKHKSGKILVPVYT